MDMLRRRGLPGENNAATVPRTGDPVLYFGKLEGWRLEKWVPGASTRKNVSLAPIDREGWSICWALPILGAEPARERLPL